MALLGQILSTILISGATLGSIANTTTISSASLGSLLNTTDISTGSTEQSPSSFTSGHEYVTDRDAWLYKPIGYEDNSNDYPLLIFGHGYGERSTDINDVLLHGAPKYINAGDEYPCLVFCPQIPSGDYTISDWDAAVSYVTGSCRVDINRIYSTGLSGGGFMARDSAMDRPNVVAATVVVASNMGSGWVWSGQTEVAHFWIHGTADSNQTNGQQTLLNGANAVDRILPFNTLALWNINHTDFVWDTSVYNRKERTDSTGTATFDYVRWLMKHSRDATQRAELHVDNAEETELIEDYREALRLTNMLTAGTDKTNLLNRLSTLKTTINNGGRFFLIDFGATTSSYANINNMSSATAGQTVSNLTDDDGNSSTIDFTIVAQHATSPGSRMNGVSRANGPYFGFDKDMYSDGLRIQGGVTGSSKYVGLDSAKTYTVRIYHTYANGFTDKSELTAIINGVTKSQYSEVNNFFYLEFTGISPNGSNEIPIVMYPSGTGSPIKNTQVCVFELYESA